MSRPAREGGAVQISGVLYKVIEVLGRDGDWFLIDVLSGATGKVLQARSEHWRGGCGPWKITESHPVITRGEFLRVGRS